MSSGNVCLNIDDKVCFEKKPIAENFNTFFTTVACTVVKKLPKGLHKYGSSFVNSFYRNKKTFSFSLVSENKILKYN